jgi:Sec-independent protein translocase protein TatA
MFALTGGELAMVVFIFALVWGAGALPRFGARVAERLVTRQRSVPREGGEDGHEGDGREGRSQRDGG